MPSALELILFQILLRISSRHNTTVHHDMFHVVSIPSLYAEDKTDKHVSRWKTEEQPLRIGIWISGQAFGSIVGQGIDYGAISVRGVYAEHPWKWIYVILGSITMGFAVIMALMFPDSPMKAAFLTVREKEIAVMRVQKNNTGMQTRKFKKDQFFGTFKDPQLYILCIIAFSFAFANGALGRYVQIESSRETSLTESSFGALLVSSFGYSNEQALKWCMPASGIAVSSMLLSG